MWGQVGRFGLTGDRVDESQIGAGIGELGRVEMFQQAHPRFGGLVGKYHPKPLCGRQLFRDFGLSDYLV